MAQRINTVFQSAVRTTPQTSGSITGQASKNVSLDIRLTAFTGTSVTFTVEAYDSAANEWFAVLAGVALAAAGRQRLNIGPDFPAIANVAANTVLPRQLRVVTSGTFTSTTFSVFATFGN